VVQLVGHLTVNEDGEGSNPSAPANFPRENDRLADLFAHERNSRGLRRRATYVSYRFAVLRLVPLDWWDGSAMSGRSV
jgi:hypothetical protein